MEIKHFEQTEVEIGSSLFLVRARGYFNQKDCNDFTPTYESLELLIDTPKYDGPLDLLLHLIKKHGIDIFDIPIALITSKYLSELEKLKELNLDIAGEFLVMAAELALIKSKMLLPKEEIISEQSTEEKDPREELVKRLIKYQIFKAVATDFKNMPCLGTSFYKRHEDSYDEVKLEIDNKSTIKNIANIEFDELLSHLVKALKNEKEEIVHTVKREKISLRARIDDIVALLKDSPKVSFPYILQSFFLEEKTDVIVSFLACLELAKLKVIAIETDSDCELLSVKINKENFNSIDMESNDMLTEY